MRLKELRGLPVIDPTAARKIGTVADYQIDPAARRLAALDVNPGDGGDGQRVAVQRIRRVGSSAVVLTARGGAMANSPVEPNDKWLDGSTLVGLEVMNDDGMRIGQLIDATFNQDTLEIQAYLLHGGSLLDSLSGRRNHIDPDQVQACSRELMLVSSSRASELSEAATPEDEPAPQETPVPLKDADRVTQPSVEAARDGQPASGSATRAPGARRVAAE